MGLSVSANAQVTVVDSGSCGDSLTYFLYSDSTLNIYGSGAMADFAVYSPWYAYNGAIKTVIIGDSVTTIGWFAFYSCGLDSVKIGSSVDTIRISAFESCNNLISIVIPNNVKSIEQSAFSYCWNLASVSLGNGLRNIEGMAFEWCQSITSITIPDSVESIGYGAFFRCRGLKTVNFNAINCTLVNGGFSYGAFPYCDSLTTLNIGNQVKTIPDYIFGSCNKLLTVTIPNNVVSIGNGAFVGCSGLTSATIGNSVVTIGDTAFWGCTGLTSLTIGNSVARIGNYAFFTCYSLSSITIPNSVTSIGNYAFYYCGGLTFLTIGNSVASIGNWAFTYCDKLTSLVLPNSLMTIGNYAFFQCEGLAGILIIPDSTVTIGQSAFFSCWRLDSLIIGTNVDTIEQNAFGWCSGLQTVNYNAIDCKIAYSPLLGNPSFTTLNIGNQVKTIPKYAFYNCNSLTGTLIFPDSLTSIGDSAFLNCSGLDTIISDATTPPVLGNNVFQNVPANIPVYIPCFTYSSYSNDWNYFSNFIINGHVDSTFYSKMICYNTSYTDSNFTTPIYTAGTYYTTLANSTNCDSVICLTLGIYPPIPLTRYLANICQGNAFNDVHFTNLTQAGQYYDTVSNVNGCDSVIELTLTVDMPPVFNYSDTICEDGIYSDIYFTGLNQTGIYSDTLRTVLDCDSLIVNFTLYHYPSSVYNYSDTICVDAVFSDIYFSGLTIDSTYSDTLQSIHGCDSLIVNFTLYHYPIATIYNYSDTVCEETAYSDIYFKGLTLTGSYSDTLRNARGCDSLIVNFTLYHYPSVREHNYSDTICEDGTYSDIYFSNLTLTGKYSDTLRSIHGCDSLIVNFTLYHYPSVAEYHYFDTICVEATYSDIYFKGLSQTGTYSRTLRNIHGCDSLTVNLTLYHYPSVEPTTYSDTICGGTTYNDANFTNLTQAGVYYATLPDINGCDSVIELTLVVKNLPTVSGLNIAKVDNVNVFVIFWSGNGTAYDLYCNNNFLANLAATTYIDSNLIEGETYCYKIRAINDDGCASAFSDEVCETYGDIGINEWKIENGELRIYPNPVNYELKIINYEGGNIEIFNIMGQKLLSIESLPSLEPVINVTTLSSGMYFLKTGNKVAKFIKE